MIDIRTSAPGKAVIAGEYVVLAGAPAISMALNRRARVRVVEIDDSAHRVSAPGYLEESFRFCGEADGAVIWLDELPDAGSFALLECVWKQVGTSHKGGLSITLNTADFFDPASGSKLGLGSSAALTTALTSALVCLQRDNRSAESLAAKAHRDFQQGVGSGIDIATAVYGGVIEYKAGQPVTTLRWPTNLSYRVLWSGKPVSTTEKLSRLVDQSSGPGNNRVAALSRELTGAWKKGEVTSVLSVLRQYTDALEQYSIDQRLGIFEAGHQELADKAKAHRNIVYKPCGAGGGDIGIVLGESIHDVDLFAEDAVASGFSAPDILLDIDGVTTEELVSEGNKTC